MIEYYFSLMYSNNIWTYFFFLLEWLMSKYHIISIHLSYLMHFYVNEGPTFCEISCNIIIAQSCHIIMADFGSCPSILWVTLGDNQVLRISSFMSYSSPPHQTWDRNNRFNNILGSTNLNWQKKHFNSVGHMKTILEHFWDEPNQFDSVKMSSRNWVESRKTYSDDGKSNLEVNVLKAANKRVPCEEVHWQVDGMLTDAEKGL